MTEKKDLVATVEPMLRQAHLPEHSINKIITEYTNPWRKYHSLEHLVEMYKHVKRYDPELIAAIAMHDYYYAYEPMPLGYNEFESANAVENLCAEAFDLIEVKEIQKAVIATSFFLVTQSLNQLSKLAQLLCDYDLSNLALPYEDMCYFSNLAIEERKVIMYNSWQKNPTLFMAECARGQIYFFKSMLNRAQIYYINTHWETPARENMIRRISDLRNVAVAGVLTE
jgi:predicted metal-dependent HD superfamily phosphohydrolase